MPGDDTFVSVRSSVDEADRLYRSAIDRDTTDAYVIEGTLPISGSYGLAISIRADADSSSTSTSVDARVDATWTFCLPAARSRTPYVRYDFIFVAREATCWVTAD